LTGKTHISINFWILNKLFLCQLIPCICVIVITVSIRCLKRMTAVEQRLLSILNVKARLFSCTSLHLNLFV